MLRGRGWRSEYLGKPSRLPPPRHRETHYIAEIRHWNVPADARVAHLPVVFRCRELLAASLGDSHAAALDAACRSG